MIVNRSIFLSLCLLSPFAFTAEEMLVYWPTEYRTWALQEELIKNCPNFETLAFGRSVDFYIETKNRKPLVIISFDLALKKANYKIFKKGTKNQRSVEDYILFDFNNIIDLKQLDNIRVGGLDILGRDKMEAFLVKSLNANIEFVRVAKVEDILPLINFDIADVALVSKTHLKSLKALTERKLITTDAKMTLSLPFVGIRDNKPETKKKVQQCLDKISVKAKEIFGVDEWK